MVQAKNPAEAMRAMAERVMAGEITRVEGSALLGLSRSRLGMWMRDHGYPCGAKPTRIDPTERDINAMRQYWRRDCNMQDLMEYTGRSYPVIKRWIDAGIGKE